MDLGTALTAVQTIISVLQCSELRDFCSSMRCQEGLANLEKTVQTVNAVLLDAELMQGRLSNEQTLYIQELKDAVYDADDLLDEYFTLAQRDKLNKGNKFQVINHVQLLKKCAHTLNMSREIKKCIDTLNMSQKLKKIREKLAQITKNHQDFRLNIDPRPLRVRREETCGYVRKVDIIGRDDDVNRILSMMPDFSVEKDISVLSIVGMGGLGKTALAQLVYAHHKVKTAFDSRLWVCVSDQDQNQFDLREILGKILGGKPEASTLHLVQTQLSESLHDKRFLLVLDDVWTEKRDEWLKLEEVLKRVGRGGWVLVTTRSKATAEIVGNGKMHELEGLSEDDSWHLFERVAFQEAKSTSDLVELGKKIVKRCKNVPLAIRTLGTLLYGQEKDKWERVF